MKKILYYIILIVAFVIIFAIDIIVIAYFNLNLLYAMPLGVVFVIYASRFVKSAAKFLIFSNNQENTYLNDKKETSKEVVDNPSIIAFKTQNIGKENERGKSSKEIPYVVDNKKAVLWNYLLIFSYLIAILSLGLSIYTLKTDYPKRQKYEKKLKEYRDESEAKFYIKTSIYERFFENKTSTEPKDNIGEMFGKFISAYHGWNSGGYHYSYDVTKYYYDPYYRRELPDYRKTYKTFRYDYTVNLSVYNIKEQMRENGKTFTRDQCKSNIKSYLDSLCIDYSPMEDKECFQLIYSTFEGRDKTLKSIFFANNNIYELTTSWVYKDKWKNRDPRNEIDNKMVNTHNEILDSINTIRMDEIISSINLKIVSFLGMFVFFFIIFYCICFRMNGVLTPKGKGNKLLMFISIITIINFFLIVAQYGSIYFATIKHEDSTLAYLYIFAASVAIMNMPTLGFISKNNSESCQYDYLLTSGIKVYLKNRTQTVAEYKSVISFVTYPFFVFGNLPCGILLLPFWVLFITIQIVLLEIRRWIQWLYMSETTSVENCTKSKINIAFVALFMFIVIVAFVFIVGWPGDLMEMLGFGVDETTPRMSNNEKWYY